LTSLVLTGSFAMCMVSAFAPSTATAQSPQDPYWRNHWDWFDNTYRPYYSRRVWPAPTVAGPNLPDGPTLRQMPYGTQIGGGFYHAPSPTDPVMSMESRGTTTIGGGFYHAPSSYRRALTTSPAESDRRRPLVDQPNRLNYGWY